MTVHDTVRSAADTTFKVDLNGDGRFCTNTITEQI